MFHTVARWAVLFSAVAIAPSIRGDDANPAAPPVPPAPDAPVIRFLTRDEAKAAIVEEKVEPYFSLLTPLDMAAKTGQAMTAGDKDALQTEIKKRYQDEMRDFTDAEQAAIADSIKFLHPVLRQHYPLMARTPWTFIKKATALEGGAHFTREHCVVLSEQFPALMASLKTKRDPQEFARMVLGLVLHEQCHVLQRQHPKLFAKMYKDLWGVEHAEKIESCKWLDARVLVNPDGVDVNWIVPVKVKLGDAETMRYLWPRILMTKTEGVPKMFRDMELAVLELEKTDAGYRVKLNADESPVRGPMQQAAELKAIFPHGNAYHPNEAAAAAIPTIILTDAFANLPRPGGGDAKLQEFEGRVRKWMRENWK